MNDETRTEQMVENQVPEAEADGAPREEQTYDPQRTPAETPEIDSPSEDHAAETEPTAEAMDSTPDEEAGSADTSQPAPETEEPEEPAPSSEVSTEPQHFSEAEEIHEEDEASDTLTAQEEAEMNRLIDSTMPSYEVGEIITGRILKVTPEDVVVDIGSKSEGIIPLKEFMQDRKDPNVFIGKEVDVMVVQRENKDGLPVLSRMRAKERRAKAMARKAFESGDPVECVVQEILKGGFQVDVDGLRGFIPFSQMGPHSRTPEQQQALIGQTIKAKIIEMRGKRDLILSQRAFLEEERARLRKETMEKLEEGRWIKGRVKNLTDFGAFIDLGGIDGLLHVNDMSWGHVGHPREVVQVDQELEVMVLKIDGERISLGLKQAKQDPWLTVASRYPTGCKVSGRVTSLAKYGAFVELEEGVEGLVHVSEISWVRRLRHPSEELKVGDEVNVQVLSIDEERRRISLSIREATTDPWTLAKANYPIGTEIEGQVTGLTDFGAFVRLPEGIDGMIHVSDLSWTEKVQHPKQVLKKGSNIQCKVLDIDPGQQRISLGLKQMTPDPWDLACEKYRVGDVVDVTIVKMTDFGAFVELESGVEGLAHASTLPKGDEGPKVGENARMKITKFDKHNRKISLSMKEYQREQERREVEQYMSTASGSFNSLGDLIHEALQSKQAEIRAEDESVQEAETAETEPAAESSAEETSGTEPIAEPSEEQPVSEERDRPPEQNVGTEQEETAESAAASPETETPPESEDAGGPAPEAEEETPGRGEQPDETEKTPKEM